jgi:hypothetical protein
MQIKVETDLFYQACDELGLLVIQDMPSLRPSQSKTGANCQRITILPDAKQQAEFARQLDLLVNQLKSYPSIATWVCWFLCKCGDCFLTISFCRSFTTKAGAR